MPDFSLPLDPADASFGVQSDLDLIVESTNSFDSGMIPSRYSLFDVESYYVVKGLPFREGNYGLAVATVCGINAVSNSVPVLASELDLGFAAHWIPVADLFVEGATWTPIKGTAAVLNVGNGSNPGLVNSEYLLKQSYVSSTVMRLENGDYFHTNAISWNKELSFVVTFVPKLPVGGEYVIIETNQSIDNYGNEVIGDYVGLRYNSLGQIVFYSGDDVLWKFSTVGGYLSRPIIVGLDISAVNKTVRVTVIDNNKVAFSSHDIEHSYSGEVYVGYSPSALYSSSSMDILDIAMWNDDMSNNVFDYRVQKLNQQYGVSL